MWFSRGLAAAFLFSLSGYAIAADSVPAPVGAAVKDRGRPAWDFDHDGARKPDQVLAFSGIKPGMVVAELAPSDKGYYTRMLAKLVGPKGKIYAVVPFTGALAAPTGGARPVDDILAIQNIADYSNVVVLWEQLAAFDGQFSIPEQVDAVLIDNSYSALHSKAYEVGDKTPAVVKAIFGSLKPGGTVTIVDYAAAKGSGFTAAETLGRVEADAVKKEFADAGFTADGESTALVNASDDHAKNSSETGDKSDQFVLRFKKPANATGDKRPPKAAMAGYFGNTSISNEGIEDKIPRQERHVFYNEDGTYQEFGRVAPGRPAPLQQGTWYWDAAGHNCMIHQYPANQRQLIVCHEIGINKKVGDTWMDGNTPYKLVKGYVPLE